MSVQVDVMINRLRSSLEIYQTRLAEQQVRQLIDGMITGLLALVPIPEKFWAEQQARHLVASGFDVHRVCQICKHGPPGSPSSSVTDIERRLLLITAAAFQLNAAPDPKKFDMTTAAGLTSYQRELQKYARLMDMISSIMAQRNDMIKSVIRNIRA